MGTNHPPCRVPCGAVAPQPGQGSFFGCRLLDGAAFAALGRVGSRGPGGQVSSRQNQQGRHASLLRARLCSESVGAADTGSLCPAAHVGLQAAPLTCWRMLPRGITGELAGRATPGGAKYKSLSSESLCPHHMQGAGTGAMGGECALQLTCLPCWFCRAMLGQSVSRGPCACGRRRASRLFLRGPQGPKKKQKLFLYYTLEPLEPDC